MKNKKLQEAKELWLGTIHTLDVLNAELKALHMKEEKEYEEYRRLLKEGKSKMLNEEVKEFVR
jgi:hypothetical protein